jgi:hypothetical protein
MPRNDDNDLDHEEERMKFMVETCDSQGSGFSKVAHTLHLRAHDVAHGFEARSEIQNPNREDS